MNAYKQPGSANASVSISAIFTQEMQQLNASAMRDGFQSSPGELNLSGHNSIDSGNDRGYVAHLTNIEGIGNITGLTNLNLSYNDTGDPVNIPDVPALNDFSPLRNSTRLQRLNVDEDYLHYLSDTELRSFGGITSLEELSAEKNELTTAQLVTLASLSDIQHLKGLDLNVNRLDVLPQDTVDGFVGSLRNFSFDDNQVSEVDTLAALNATLTDLSFKRNQVRDVTELKQLTNLKNLHFDDNQVGLRDDNTMHASLANLGSLSQLSNVSFDRNHIYDMSGVYAAASNPSNTFSGVDQTIDLGIIGDAGFPLDVKNGQVSPNSYAEDPTDVQIDNVSDGTFNYDPVTGDLHWSSPRAGDYSFKFTKTIGVNPDGSPKVFNGTVKFGVRSSFIVDFLDSTSHKPADNAIIKSTTVRGSNSGLTSSEVPAGYTPGMTTVSRDMEFDDWYPADASGKAPDLNKPVFVPSNIVTDNMKLVAHWRAMPLVIADPNNGTSGQEQTTTTQKQMDGTNTAQSGNLTQPSKDHAVFQGWVDDNGNPVDLNHLPLIVNSSHEYDPIHIHAKWADLPKVNFDYNGGAGSVSQMQTKLSGGVVQLDGTLPTGKRAGYKFIEWTYTVNGTDNVNPNRLLHVGTNPNFTDVTVHAKWIKLPTVVIDKKNDGNFEDSGISTSVDVNNNNPKLNGNIPAPNPSDNPGMIFDEWRNLDGTPFDPDHLDAPKDGDGNYGEVKVVAHWVPAPKVHLDYKGGTSNPAPSVMDTSIQGKDFNLAGDLPTPAKDGYKFGGWVYKDTSTAVDPNKLDIKGNKRVGFNDAYVEAVWRKLPVLNLIPNGGSDVPPVIKTELNPDGSVKLSGVSSLPIPTPADSQHAFLCWIDSSGKAVTTDDVTFLPNANGDYTDVTLNGRWVKLPTVDFDSQGGTAVPSTDKTGLTDNHKIKLIDGKFPVPSRSGYDFEGWVDDNGNPVDPDDLPSTLSGDEYGKVHLIAKWRKVDNPKPSIPADPSDPIDSADSSQPDNGGTSDSTDSNRFDSIGNASESEVPRKSGKKSTDLAHTGSNVLSVVFLAVLLSVLAAVGLLLSRRRSRP
ncbi:hypothetical protein KIMH_14300 [Bombiscardovia apis]|uniref:Uncharacterized protein n=2 Tax=Bombiscardovia apis TaxID=2932182 RepID=A0ABN6SH47_9BIFI|nr:hypothetical protein KIMH_14300 [Bombiscardovia apis]